MNWTRQFILIALIYSMVLLGVGFYSGYSSWDRFLIKSATLRLTVNAATTTTIEYSNTSSEMREATRYNSPETTTTIVPRDYKETIDDFASKHTWSRTYNCQNGSWDLARQLSWKGYEASVECGYYYGNNCDPDKDYWDCRHCWVNLCLKVEPFSGEILTPKEFKEMYGR